MMKEYNQQALGNWHDLVAHSLLFLSMIAGLYIVGIIFISDHRPQIHALSDCTDELSAQVSSMTYSLPGCVVDFSAQVYSDFQAGIYAFSAGAADLSSNIVSGARNFSNYSESLAAGFSHEIDSQIYAFSSSADVLSAQIYSAYSEHQKNYLAEQPRLLRPPLVYDRPFARFHYSDDQMNKLLDRLKNVPWSRLNAHNF